MENRKYYCNQCAVSNRIISPFNAKSSNLTGTAYQCGKFMKHTAPKGTFQGKNSIFLCPTYEKYKEYIITGSISGMVEVDEFGRKSIIWYAGRETGVLYIDGDYVAPENGVRIVLPEDSKKIHAYPFSGLLNKKHICSICGNDLPYL